MRRHGWAAPALAVLVACTDEVPKDGASAPSSSLVEGSLASVGARPACLTGAPVRLERTECAHEPDALDDALGQIRLERCSVGLLPVDLAKSLLDPADPRMLTAARSAQTAPLALRPFGSRAAASFDAALNAQTPAAQAIAAASALRDAPIGETCADAAWYAPARADAPLAAALAEARRSKTFAEEEVRGIPIDLQAALVPIVRAITTSNLEIVSARGDLAREPLAALAAVPAWILGVRHFEWSSAVPKAFETVDAAKMARAAARVALAVEGARLERFRGIAIPSVDLETPAGTIVLRGPSDDTFRSEKEAPALLLDTGGNDTYLGAVASGTLARPVSVAVDLGGRDTYSYVDSRALGDGIGKRLPSDGAGRTEQGRTLSQSGRQGSGVLGAGLLFDFGDDADTYRSLAASQGAASHGVGVLFDAGGSDRYEAEGFSQGAAAWGIGLLLDRAGSDRYSLYHAGQGFGFTEGVGALVDREGSDVYWANPGDPSLG